MKVNEGDKTEAQEGLGVVKPKPRGSRGRKTEAQAGPGAAKPNVKRDSGSTWGRSRGTHHHFFPARLAGPGLSSAGSPGLSRTKENGQI